jgi:hypothetical protein
MPITVGPFSPMTHVRSRSTATMEESVWDLPQPTLSTFPVGGNRSTLRKPTTFDRLTLFTFHNLRDESVTCRTILQLATLINKHDRHLGNLVCVVYYRPVCFNKVSGACEKVNNLMNSDAAILL